MTWVVVNQDSGWTDETMRFEDSGEAAKFIVDNVDPDYGNRHEVRYESESEHPHNLVAVGQIWMDDKWVDFARDTPQTAIAWAKREPEGKARVVDWIGKRLVIWPVPELEEYRS
jgi:hypothetical protein